MPEIVPTIPETITVHLGPPSSDASNVTVPFIDYVKNVASSEVYPTWDTSALRANILAIVSFALNRVYLEYYRSRGYPFDITNSTAYDQRYVYGRSTFENIDRLVDELYNSYIRRQGFIEPLAAKFCNGTTVTCQGMSQWGSQGLAQQGYNSVQILRNYYGDNIEIVTNAPVQNPAPSYPGQPLRLGSVGPDVVRLQFILNRISDNYPLIPKLGTPDGIFGPQTERAVRTFQSIFDLTQDGIVGRITWNALTRLFVGITRLSELYSEGQQLSIIPWSYPDILQEGASGQRIVQLQYMLSVLSSYIPEISDPGTSGIFNGTTRQAVLDFQQWAGLSPTGLVGEVTWNRLFREYEAVANSEQREPALQFPEQNFGTTNREANS